MKHTINDVLYNTATSKFIGEWRNRYDIQNPKWCHEMLFKTVQGLYFTWGCGGNHSTYASFSKKAQTGITPLDYDEAREWAHSHLTYDVFVKEFSMAQVA